MENKEKLLDHNYDGIQELDNSLPPWWLKLFYITILWGIGYFAYYHIFDIGDSPIEQYNKEMGIVTESSDNGFSLLKGYQSPYSKIPANYKEPASGGGAEEAAVAKEESAKTESQEVAANYELVTDPARLQNGSTVFATNCIACHGTDGQGGIGPNLTDNYWINGDGSFNKIVNVIQNGVPVKGMISWKPLLKEKDLIDVASHVYNLRGTNPVNAKEPQGTKYGD
jgi:cytochrome c oxidase cbb3-type subunit III